MNDKVKELREFRNRKLTNNRLTDQSDIQNIDELRSEIEAMKSIVKNKEEVSGTVEEGDYFMDKLVEKLTDIDRRLSVIEEKSKKIDQIANKEETKLMIIENINNRDIPTVEGIKNIVSETIENKNKGIENSLSALDEKIVTQSDLDLAIYKAKNSQLLWTVGTIITVISIATTVIVRAVG